MATKITQNGIISVIGPVLYDAYGSKTIDKQQVIIFIPSGVNSFGEKYGKDEYWEYNVIGKTVKDLNIIDKFKVGDKVTVEGYLNSQNYQIENAKPYSFKIRLASIKPYVKP